MVLREDVCAAGEFAICKTVMLCDLHYADM